MRAFLYRCPNTNFNVQGLVESPPQDADHYVAQLCPVCAKVHLVNPATGKLVSEDYGVPKDP